MSPVHQNPQHPQVRKHSLYWALNSFSFISLRLQNGNHGLPRCKPQGYRGLQPGGRGMWRPQDCSHRWIEQDTLRLWAVHPCDRRSPVFPIEPSSLEELHRRP